MSLEAITAVRRLPRTGIHLEPRDRFVLYALADHADDRHEAWPSHRTLAEWTGYAASTVRDALAALEAAGLITAERQARPNGSETSKRYRLRFVDGHPALPAAGTPPCRDPAPPLPGAGTLEPSLNPHLEPPSTSTPAAEPEPPPEIPTEVEDVAESLEMSQALLAAERRRHRSYATSILGRQHPAAKAGLTDLQGVYAWKPAQYAVIAEAVLDLARTHGGDRVAAAIRATLEIGEPVRAPLAYVRKILSASPPGPTAGPIDLPTLDDVLAGRP